MFKYIYIIFAVSVFFNKLHITKKIHKMDTIKGKILHPWVTKLIYAFYILPFLAPPIEFLLVKREINYIISVIFFIVYIMGWTLSLWAIKTIGNYWTIDIEIRDAHPLIKKGPYRYMRHPHYLYTFIELFGLPLVANAYYSLAIIMVIYIPVMSLRIYYEEKEMIKKFGEEYLKYKKEVWGILPYPVFKKGIKNG